MLGKPSTLRSPPLSMPPNKFRSARGAALSARREPDDCFPGSNKAGAIPAKAAPATVG
jgi:hypothetical protein